jgi:hypothetical protein
MSDSEYDSDGEEQRETNGETLEFGFGEEEKQLTGRRLKAMKEHKRKMRPGTFGGFRVECGVLQRRLLLLDSYLSGCMQAALAPADCGNKRT